jgi:hypothetical protein
MPGELAPTAGAQGRDVLRAADRRMAALVDLAARLEDCRLESCGKLASKPSGSNSGTQAGLLARPPGDGIELAAMGDGGR